MSFRRKDQEGRSRLVFFDRPCHTAGAVNSNGKEVNTALNIPAPGFYLLAIRGTESGWRLVAEPVEPTTERELVITFFDSPTLSIGST